ncbi:hypothetical protein V6N11_076895 [Hibiscus sabdariffa]|uniref:Uncharacterized protein n=1 Tax=Hibiscus sabdariffa TaxID=183260 RepID=A0ABR2TCE0_9ROSI
MWLGKTVLIANDKARGDRSMEVSPVKDMGQHSGTNEGSRKGDKQGDSIGKTGGVPDMASNGEVVPVPITLNPSNNTTVRVVNMSEFRKPEVCLEENMVAYDELVLMEQVTDLRDTKVKGTAQKAPTDNSIPDTHEAIDGAIHWRSNEAFTGDGVSQ